ncbi:MAG TPA: CRISPR-associated endonuclease Cas2 [bacterium]|nr:CRISPR-associated endonuclease Cas2 [bacterium]
MFVIISYDITDDRRRNRVSKMLENYGTRVQYSVFECIIEKEQLEKIKVSAKSLIDLSTDSVRYYALCEACFKKVSILGAGEISSDPDFYVV